MARVLGIDLGTRRIGVAVSDPTGTLASPHSVVERSGDPGGDRQRLAALVSELEVELVVVGLPLSMSGAVGPAAEAAQADAAALAELVNVEVVLYDERLTTVSADRALRAAQGHDRGRARGRDRRRAIDPAAAAVMLQSWLDGPRRGAHP